MTNPDGKDTLAQLRDRLAQDAEAIRYCFTQDDALADQVALACQKLLDLLHFYGVDKAKFPQAYILQGEARKLDADFRAGTLSSADYKVASRKISLEVLNLTGDAEAKAMARMDALMQTPQSSPTLEPETKPRASAKVPAMPLDESIRSAQRSQAAGAVVFRGEHLSKTFPGAHEHALNDVSLELRKGEITGLVGMNGSGKSTLLRVIAGDLMATRGERAYPALHCASDDWLTLRRRVIYVPQGNHFTLGEGAILDVLIRHAACYGHTGQEGQDKVEFYLNRLGLVEHAHKEWRSLSVGYRTRFELARAMLSDPAMLVLDEPLAALDIPTQQQFLQDLRTFANSPSSPMPVIISSQHLFEIEAVADHMIVLQRGEVLRQVPVHRLGEGRNSNRYALHCNLSLPELRECVSGLAVMSVQELGFQRYLLLTPTTVPGEDVLAALMGRGVSFRYFRDESHSCRDLLD